MWTQSRLDVDFLFRFFSRRRRVHDVRAVEIFEHAVNSQAQFCVIRSERCDSTCRPNRVVAHNAGSRRFLAMLFIPHPVLRMIHRSDQAKNKRAALCVVDREKKKV